MNPVPTVTVADVEESIINENYFYDGLLTICRLTMTNGTKVVGESACAHPDKYNKQLGEELSKKDAMGKIWPRLGYALKEQLHLIEKAGKPTGKILELGSPITYVGTKVVHAVPMDRGEYNALRGWGVPSDENPSDLGYLVQYTDGGLCNVEGYTGYLSWSPRDVFEGAYTTGVRQSEETFFDRLVVECHQLKDRFNKLDKFIGSEGWDKIDPMEQSLMCNQYDGMKIYLNSLEARIVKHIK